MTAVLLKFCFWISYSAVLLHVLLIIYLGGIIYLGCNFKQDFKGIGSDSFPWCGCFGMITRSILLILLKIYSANKNFTYYLKVTKITRSFTCAQEELKYLDILNNFFFLTVSIQHLSVTDRLVFSLAICLYSLILSSGLLICFSSSSLYEDFLGNSSKKYLTFGENS